MKQKNPVIYYENELEDEFSTAKITPKPIDGNYDYDGGLSRRVGRLFWYRMLVRPLAFVFLKLKFHHKIVNRECLKKIKNTGFFLYGNHTNAIADALVPTVLCYPVGVSVIVHSNNVSMPVLGKITPSLGAIPLPDDREAMKQFSKALERVMEKEECVAIYPEAHIWPYYTGIREFKDGSFRYPVQYKVPVFCFTNTYQKRKHGRGPQIVTYVDGPFYPAVDGTSTAGSRMEQNGSEILPAKARGLSHKEQRKRLHAQVLSSMKQASKNSNVELIRYVKKGNEEEE